MEGRTDIKHPCKKRRKEEEEVHRVVPMGRSRGLYTIGRQGLYVRLWIPHDGSP